MTNERPNDNEDILLTQAWARIREQGIAETSPSATPTSFKRPQTESIALYLARRSDAGGIVQTRGNVQWPRFQPYF